MDRQLTTMQCFFCMKNETDQQFRMSVPNYEWPFPIPAGARFAMCDECSSLSPEEKATIIFDYARNEAKILAKNN